MNIDGVEMIKEESQETYNLCPPLENTQTQSRNVGSLVHLTQKFVELMKRNGGVIDLKMATDILDVQKRRIYDITNVLEGVGLIEKTRHSSMVRWRGGINEAKNYEKLKTAMTRTNKLKTIEDDLDLQLKYAKRNLKYIKEDATNKSYSYVTRDDLLQIFGEDAVFTVPKQDNEVKFKKMGNTLHVSLDNGNTIDVRLVTQQGTCTSKQNIAKLPNNTPKVSNPLRTTAKVDAKSHLVTNEHTYFCNREMKEEMQEIDNQVTARILFRKCTTGHSLRRFFPDNPDLDNPPLLQLNPPQNDYTFTLAQDEGICELFDIPCT
ncbi:transcription factor E2F2 [Teleopsis dalmanni]|uniref:transcription factor E2F2 n=1 Tax=Teleopsis dalmanni TaxID=139649 RepID=UPI0018CE22A2|nr:transcription factor E2F2 [Teleopsis dalmanni]XP_037961060.1 transcription factor E2F2 [Teleopsis dalmanni]XP_037961061.1 transcription factor E2F2 [Teleopsis dalmanni]